MRSLTSSIIVLLREAKTSSGPSLREATPDHSDWYHTVGSHGYKRVHDFKVGRGEDQHKIAAYTHPAGHTLYATWQTLSGKNPSFIHAQAGQNIPTEPMDHSQLKGHLDSIHSRSH